MKRCILFVLTLIIWSQSMFCQINKLFTTEDGLSSSSINKIIQDKTGYIWLATDKGLDKFDGDNFKEYSIRNTGNNGITDILITSIIEDRSGVIWVATHSGICSYRLDTEQFQRYIVRGTNQPLDCHITDIAEDRLGQILIATSGSGVYLFNKTLQKFESYNDLNKILSSSFISRIFVDSFGLIYVAIDNDGVYIFNPQTKKSKHFSNAKGGVNENQISAICESVSKTVYFGTSNGVYGFNRNAGVFYYIPASKGLIVETLSLSKDGNVYVGTDGSGIFRIDKNSQFYSYKLPVNIPEGLIKKIQSLYVDKNGNIWCGIKYKGLVMLGKASSKVDNFDIKSALNTTSDICVYSVYCNDKETWFGTDGDGIVIYDNRYPQIDSYSHILSSKKILNIFEDKSGYVWLATWNDGLIKMDKRTHQVIKQYKQDPLNPKSISSNRIWSITQDHNGYLWLGTSGEGLCRLDIAKEEFIALKANPGVHDYSKQLFNNWVNCLLTDSENNLWAGTSNGISKLDLKTFKFTNYFCDNKNTKGVVVKSIVQVNEQILFGTNNGLYVFNNKDSKWTKVETPDLSNSSIITIVPEKTGFVWLVCLNRIYRVSTKTLMPVAYSSLDGIFIKEFQRNSGAISPDGKIYFGGINGAVGFAPSKIKHQFKDDKLVFTDLLMYNKPVTVGQLSGGKPIISTNVNEAKKITLAFKDCFFTIHFNILNFVNSGLATYQYKMEGFDNHWQSLPPNKDKSATYTNLPHGDYKFTVKAELNDEVIYRSVDIVILPPWWATLWMKMIYIILVISILYITWLYIKTKERDRLDRERLKHLNDLNELKLQFFTNISHEIRSPVTLIINPLEKLLKRSNDPNRDLFEMMYRNAQRLLNLVNQLMDIRKIDKGQFTLQVQKVEILSYLRGIASDFQFYTDEKQIDLTVQCEYPSLYVFIDPIHFEKIIINLLSNAFKFSPNDSEIIIRVGLSEDKEKFRIEVIDSGTGIYPEMLESIFDRFVQSHSPVPKNAGTGIGLHLTRLLVSLHHGVIKAENRTDSTGAIFTIDIPFGKSHFSKEELSLDSENEYQSVKSIEMVNEISEEKESITPNETDTKSTRKNRLTIHIVEDDAEIRSYLAKELGEIYNVTESITASIAIKNIFTSPPDLIISDVMMPGLDGISFCKQVRENYLTAHIPIILLTAKNTIESIKEGLEAGTDEYMVKPFNIEILKAKIVTLLEMRKTLEYHFSKDPDFELPDVDITSHDDKLMLKINKVLTDNLSDERVNVTFLCNEIGISRVHLNRKMRELVNMSAQVYIRIYRLKYAAKLIKENKMSVAEVAYACGFTNPSHFTYRFRMFYGLTPTEYLEKEGLDKEVDID